MISSYKFIQKLWTLHNEIKIKIINEDRQIINEDLEKFTNRLVAKFTNNLEKFNYNVIIANMYETYNFLINFIKENKDLKNLKENYQKILTCFNPIIPHFTSECYNELKDKADISWPTYDKMTLEHDTINFVIQINGKKRTILNANKDISEGDLFELIKKDKIADKYLKNVKINKIIFIENRLMNILIND